MNYEEAVRLLRGGGDGVAEWNRRRAAGSPIPSLEGIDLAMSDLHGVNLSGTKLRGARFDGANICPDRRPMYPSDGSAISKPVQIHASTVTYDDTGRGAQLSSADLTMAQFGLSKLGDVTFESANLSGADFHDSFLTKVDFSGAFLDGACFHNAMLTRCLLNYCRMDGTSFLNARIGRVTWSGVDLRDVRDLDTIIPHGPSIVDRSVLAKSAGRAPIAFLRTCGLTPWEAYASRLHDPELTAAEVTDLIDKIFELRTQGPLFLGGAFISYSHTDAEFAIKLHKALMDGGANPYLDRQDFVAGPLQKQVDRAIRINDVVVLVLSEASINSDWVEHELEMARKKEKKTGRDVLCPVALDESWKDKMDDVLWRQIKKKNVLDFSKWKTKAFGPQFEKLLKGLKMYYPPSTNEGEP